MYRNCVYKNEEANYNKILKNTIASNKKNYKTRALLLHRALDFDRWQKRLISDNSVLLRDR